MSRESSVWVDVDKLPRPPHMLTWHEETPHPDYRVKIAFAYVEFEKFRRITFPNGEHMYSRMIPVQPLDPHTALKR